VANMLKPMSAFSHLDPLSTPSLTVAPREDLTMASFAAGKDQVQAVMATIKSAYGVDLPRRPARVSGKGIAFVWAGPDQWLAVAERGANRDMERELKSLLSGMASVVDQSDGRVVVRVSGPLSRQVLAKGIPIDLHPRAFGANAAAITHASHIGVIMWQLEDASTFELAMFRSYADSFAHWLIETAEATLPATA